MNLQSQKNILPKIKYFSRIFIFSLYLVSCKRTTSKKNQPLRPPLGGQLSYEESLSPHFLEAGFGQFVSHGPAVPISFPPFLGDFTGYVQAFGIGAEFFSGKRCNLDIDCGYSVQAWPFSHSPHKRSLSNFLNPCFSPPYIVIFFLDTVQVTVNRRF